MKTTNTALKMPTLFPAAQHLDATSPFSEAAQPNVIKKVSFGGMAKKSDARTACSVFPDPNREASLIAARIIQRSAACDQLEGALKTDKAELKMLVAPHYFASSQGKGEIPASVAVNSSEGEVLVCYQNRYSNLPNEEPLQAILDPALIEKYFAQSFEIKIAGAKLPQDPDQCQKLMNRLQQLFAEYQSADALQVTEGIAPKKNFHEERHRSLTVAQNLALEQACPIIATVKTKGRRQAAGATL